MSSVVNARIDSQYHASARSFDNRDQVAHHMRFV